MENNSNIYDDVAELEKEFKLPEGALRNMPIYARKPSIDAILKVKEMEKNSHFRQGLYYIVLTDLCENTAFNVKYGDAEGDVRTEWFQTAAIKSIGDISVRNYVNFVKMIGDAALLMFSSFKDVYEWSETFSVNLESMTSEYIENMNMRNVKYDEEKIDERLEDFRLRARRLVHIGEVSYKEDCDPICLSVNQTFKIEKEFSETELGCTQSVADAIRPKLQELKVKLRENKLVDIPGFNEKVMTYYVEKFI